MVCIQAIILYNGFENYIFFKYSHISPGSMNELNVILNMTDPLQIPVAHLKFSFWKSPGLNM